MAALAISQPAIAQRGPVNSLSPGTSSISGVVIDALTKQPIAGCTVSVNLLYVPGNRSAVTTTNNDGAYAFNGIPDAEYHVQTLCNAYLPTCYRAAGTEPPRCNNVGVVIDQRKSNIDISLVPAAKARGRVVDTRGRPIEGATVRLGWPVRDALPVMNRPTQTRRDGSFELLDLPPGEWRLEVELPEAPGALRPPTVYFPGVLNVADAGSIELVAGQTLENITFVAPRISDNTLTVRVVTIEQTLSQLDVSFIRVEPLVTRPVPIDASGTGTLTGLAPGNYFLTARGRAGDRTLTAFDFVDFIGGEQEVLLYMQPAARIVGRIIGEKGAAIAFDGARVSATLTHNGVAINPLAAEEAPVALDGTFRLEGLFGTRQLQLLGLDPWWEIRSITEGRSDVTGPGIALQADTEAKVVIVLGRR